MFFYNEIYFDYCIIKIEWNFIPDFRQQKKKSNTLELQLYVILQNTIMSRINENLWTDNGKIFFIINVI